MKLHLCCGTVYLKDYINVDIQGYFKNNSSEVGLLEIPTSIDNYYRNPLKSEPLSKRGHFVIDERVDILVPWPWKENTISEIVMIQSLEHFLPHECKFIISECYRVLQLGGRLLLDVPDIPASVKKWQALDINIEFLNRLIYCNHKDKYSIHKICFTEGSLTDLLLYNGNKWGITFKEIVEHEYPTIGLEAIKQ